MHTIATGDIKDSQRSDREGYNPERERTKNLQLSSMMRIKGDGLGSKWLCRVRENVIEM